MEKWARWGLGLAAVLLLLLAPEAYSLWRVSTLEQDLERRLAVLEETQERLTQEETRLQEDPTYIEGLIRTTFKYSQPGEIVIPLEDE